MIVAIGLGDYHGRHDEAILAARNGVPMTVHDEFRANAAFLSRASVEEGGHLADPVATTFLIHFYLEDKYYSMRKPRVVYAVTAKHCVIDLRDDEPIYILFNKHDGGYKELKTFKRDWFCHEHTDVAMCQIEDGLEGLIAASLDWDTLVPRDKRTQHNFSVRLGDPVFTVGLYLGFMGQNSIQPIARFGHISLMPNSREKIKVAMCEADTHLQYEDLPEIEAYLIEVRGWEGQSGSPVFVSFGKTQEPFEMITGSGKREVILGQDDYARTMQPIIREGVLALRPDPVCIGLIQGYHPRELELLNTANTKYKLNLGISIVVPSEAIIELLRRGDVIMKRQETLRKIKAKPPGGLRPAASSVPKPEAPFSKSDFEDALKKSSRKISDEEQAKESK